MLSGRLFVGGCALAGRSDPVRRSRDARMAPGHGGVCDNPCSVFPGLIQIPDSQECAHLRNGDCYHRDVLQTQHIRMARANSRGRVVALGTGESADLPRVGRHDSRGHDALHPWLNLFCGGDCADSSSGRNHFRAAAPQRRRDRSDGHFGDGVRGGRIGFVRRRLHDRTDHPNIGNRPSPCGRANLRDQLCGDRLHRSDHDLRRMGGLRRTAESHYEVKLVSTIGECLLCHLLRSCGDHQLPHHCPPAS